jgi:hypothetical protein
MAREATRITLKGVAAGIAAVIAAGVALTMLAAAIPGCGPGKELPDEIPKTTENTEKGSGVPTASEPAARAYVEKALKAFTGGKPELVTKVKFSRAVLNGTSQLPIENRPTEFSSERTIAAAWPDRFAVTNHLTKPGLELNAGIWLRGKDLTMLHGSVEFNPPNRAEIIQTEPANVALGHWMATLVPLADPRAIVFDFQSASVIPPQGGQPQPVQMLKLALPDFPVFQLAFDPKTDLLIRVESSIPDQGVRVRKLWTASDHKPGPDGRILPGKTEVRHNNTVVEIWTVEKWEFPAEIPETEFAPPTPKK